MASPAVNPKARADPSAMIFLCGPTGKHAGIKKMIGRANPPAFVLERSAADRARPATAIQIDRLQGVWVWVPLTTEAIAIQIPTKAVCSR